MVRVEDRFEKDHPDALMVVKNGKIIDAKYWNGMNEDTRHPLLSASKSYAGTAVGCQWIEVGT